MSSQLQDKLQQFEAMPPKDLWLAIEERLEVIDNNLQERLSTFEATPPSGAWSQIEAGLSTASTQKKATILNTSWFRYAAAAVVLGIIALTVFTLAFDQPKNTIAQQPVSPDLTNSTTATPSITKANNTPTSEPIHSNTGNTANTVNSTLKTTSLSNTLASTTTKRYKVVAKEDGKLVRLSQKALAVFDCAIKSTANTSERCKENIQNMQEKMATSIISPTADFAGLIDMIKTLEENK
jgi:hypothetical protein